ncbi:MAG TPA: DUF4396 domain-containing protein [Rubrobacteraceae bacterium]|nr:DUF4396 domain-containing protein [Rubrobacteraceae bacterium]
MLVIPGAMEAGIGNFLFWGSLAFALAVAFVAAFPVNRYLISWQGACGRPPVPQRPSRRRP